MAFVFRQGDLPKLDLQVDRGTDFRARRTQWDAYSSLSGLATKDNATKVQALTLCFSRETLMIVDNLGLSRDQRADVDSIIQAVQNYVEGHINESVERRNFRGRTQHAGETFDDFLVSLRELAKTCKFCSDECAQKNIRDQIIEGLRDGDTIENLLREKDLTLQKTILQCRGQEAAKRQRAEIASEALPNIKRTSTPNPTPPRKRVHACQGCGGDFHPGGRRQCPAFGATCHNCDRIGHFANICRSQRSRQSPGPLQPSTNAVFIPDLKTANVSSTSASDNGFERAPTISVHISSLNGSTDLNVLPDSGADISVAGLSMLKSLREHRDNLLPSNLTPHAVNGMSMKPVGRIPVTLQLQGASYNDHIHIYPEVSGTILSWRAARELNILPHSYPQPSPCGALTSGDGPDPGDIAKPEPPTVALTSTDASDPRDAIKADFPTVFHDNVTSMDGEVFHIALSADAEPFCVNTPRTVPFAYREKLEKELELLQSQGIIAPVTEPTEWCAPIVVAPKKGSSEIRMCVDLSHLNKYVRRERYQSPTPAQAVADIASEQAKVFTKIDARKGYHQCPLDEESQLLTTFITPCGRFKYLRAPYGISSISEHYNRRMDEALAGLSGFRRIVDDIAIYDSDPGQHDHHVRTFLQRCSDLNITLNADKFVYAQPEIPFAGFILSAAGYQIDPAITDAIRKFPTPSNRTDLRSFFGLVNQLSACTNVVAPSLAPLRSLLSIKNDFTWSSTHDSAFVSAKDSLTSSPVLAYFDVNRTTRLCTDASRQGLGFILQQMQDDTWRLVQAGSRFLSGAESRYAVIELELLAVSWAVQKCQLFLAGMSHFQVITDHHPLISILNNQCLNEIENPRLQRLKARLMPYNFTAKWIKGTLNQAPDALSRSPVSDPLPQEALGEQDFEGSPVPSCAEVRSVIAPAEGSVRMESLRECADVDEEYQQLKRVILAGFPKHRGDLAEPFRRYWSMRQHLSIDGDFIVCGCRLLIPAAMRREVLQKLHESHQGAVRTKQRARLVVYWPGIDHDIDNIVLSCKRCQDTLPANCKEPIIAKPTPSRPFQEVAGDFCSYAGRDYLILVDCFSDWPDIIAMGRDTTATKLVSVVRQSFCRTGVPDVFWSDQGPQFTSNHFQEFAQQWGFRHATSTPRYPQSNGKIEATVKSMKKLISASWRGRHMDEDSLARALLQYRNTPSRKDDLSPAQKLFGRPVQDSLPAHRRAFTQDWQRVTDDTEKHAEENREKVEEYYNQHAHSLPDIQVGSNVAIHNGDTKQWDTYGLVVGVGPYRRYYIKLPSGRILVRNRRFLRRRVPLSLHSGSDTAPPPQSRLPPPQGVPSSAPGASPPTAQPPAQGTSLPSTRPPTAQTPSAPWRSSRPRRRPKYLIEEIRQTSAFAPSPHLASVSKAWWGGVGN